MARQCPKCLRHSERLKIVKTDPDTKKKWLITTCPDCNYESDLDEFKETKERKSPRNNSSTVYKHPPTVKGFDEGWWEEHGGEGL